MRLGFVVVLLTFALAGCGGDDSASEASAEAPGASDTSTVATKPSEPEQEPEDFFEELFGYYFKGQNGRAWELLHPGHQAIVSRSKFDECLEAGFPSGIELEGVEVEEVYDEPIDVPRIPEKTSKAVTLTVKASAGDETQSYTDTYHLIDLGGRWVWILEPKDVAAYELGECPP